jgi:hypothetical protein
VVVEKIAGMAARDVRGVYALGSGFARSMGSVRERMPGAGSGKSTTCGVSVEVGEHRLGQVLVDSEDGAAARLDGRTLEDVVEEEAQALDGVSRARVRLTGRRTAPAARVRLLLEPHADPERILGQLTRETLAHARDSAGLDRLPSKVRLREARHHADRVA